MKKIFLCAIIFTNFLFSSSDEPGRPALSKAVLASVAMVKTGTGRVDEGTEAGPTGSDMVKDPVASETNHKALSAFEKDDDNDERISGRYLRLLPWINPVTAQMSRLVKDPSFLGEGRDTILTGIVAALRYTF